MNWNDHIGKRYQFTAIIQWHNERHICIQDVRRTDGELLREHLFIPYTKRIKKQNIKQGDNLTITAKVNRYYKKRDPTKPRRHTNLIAQFQLTNIHILSIE